MHRIARWTMPVVAAILLGTAWAGPAAAAPRPVTITLVTHDSFAVSKSVLRTFERRTGIHVKVLPAGDAGAALNQVILTKDHPLGDLMFGVDNTLLSSALAAGIFDPYRSPQLASVPGEFQSDPRHRVTPIDHGDVCVNDDKAWFRQHHLTPPTKLEDLTNPRYRGQLVVENPATSSPGLAFLLATVSHFGEQGWRSYWQKLRANDVKVVDGWNQAYNDSFTGGEGGSGDRPLVVSYASDPAAAVYFAKSPKPSVSPVGTLLPTCYRQIEYVGILKGTAHAREARRFIDFMLSERFQADVPLQMFVLPVRDGVNLPSVFVKFADFPAHPYFVAPNRINPERKKRWIDEWTASVLR